MWRCARCEVINKDKDAKCQICGMTASCSQKWTAFLEAEEQRRAAAAEQAEKQKKLDAERQSMERASEKQYKNGICFVNIGFCFAGSRQIYAAA